MYAYLYTFLHVQRERDRYFSLSPRVEVESNLSVLYVSICLVWGGSGIEVYRDVSGV